MPRESRPTQHQWKFFHTGGLVQVMLETPEDLLALGELDQKLWVALSCPVKGSELDEGTLTLIDSDGDGLSDAQEAALGTDPANPDTEEDGLVDGAEVTAATDPTLSDTDGDGFGDDAFYSFAVDAVDKCFWKSVFHTEKYAYFLHNLINLNVNVGFIDGAMK